jgi:hypothetical protein
MRYCTSASVSTNPNDNLGCKRFYQQLDVDSSFNFYSQSYIKFCGVDIRTVMEHYIMNRELHYRTKVNAIQINFYVFLAITVSSHAVSASASRFPK